MVSVPTPFPDEEEEIKKEEEETKKEEEEDTSDRVNLMDLFQEGDEELFDRDIYDSLQLSHKLSRN